MVLKNEAKSLKTISLGQTDYLDYFNKLHPVLKGMLAFAVCIRYIDVLDKCGYLIWNTDWSTFQIT